MMDERLKKYEGLVKSTVKYWRQYITTDLGDEDIAQELRIQIWKSLQAFDPEKAKGYSEEKFVFWHVRNKIKDLIAKKHREYFEIYTSEMNLDWKNGDEAETLDRNSISKLKFERKENTDLISNLPRRQQEICVLMLQGYNNTEVAGIIGVTTSTLRVEIGKIKTTLTASAVA